MTNSEQHIALARRIVACPHFSWMPGMRTLSGETTVPLAATIGEPTVFVSGEWPVMGAPEIAARPRNTDELPDLNDPATRGCVLQLVREAWGDDLLHVVPWKCGESRFEWFTHKFGFYLCRLGGAPLNQARVGYSEAEALVAALEAAPALR